MSRILFAAAAALALVPAIAGAQVLQERNIPLGIAQEIAQATVEACATKNFNVTATVVDRAGVVRAVLRADRAGPHTVAASRDKAFTAASARNVTSAIADGAEKNPAARHLASIEGFLLLAGGVPVKVGDEVVGAVGVGGAPGGHLDEECANAGIEKVKAKLR
ncbi:GlcG/HbpS family heme-binding protein [Bosea sp. NBC_00550]|uniref:GlcG/HbpS family heme-binding protein n=1 Tax=Bosea sp. NBC_00550 TaxID=2969621 RepID=UPI0022324B4A|nr:heme-binding protein [Bosea sp. NBC_00550]UZF90688.1 heme-binding protein [Bosea sp. NBC_00550]